MSQYLSLCFCHQVRYQTLCLTKGMPLQSDQGILLLPSWHQPLHSPWKGVFVAKHWPAAPIIPSAFGTVGLVANKHLYQLHSERS